MANEKGKNKDEKKPETAAPPAAATAAGSPATVKGETALIKAGLPIITEGELDVRMAGVATALAQFEGLRTATDLSDESRAKVVTLLDLARPQRPGMEEVQTTWSITRVNICQPTTQSDAKPENAKQGDIFTQAGMLLERPLNFIPLYFHEENVLFPDGAKVPDCSAPDAKLGQPYGVCLNCPHLPFGKQNGGRGDQQQTDCQNQIVVAVLSSTLDQVYLLTFAKTSRKAGNALISLAKNDPFPWKKSYLLQTEKQNGEKGVYFTYKISPTGKENTPDAIKIAEALSGLVAASRKKMLGDWYFRAANSNLTAAAVEESPDAGALLGNMEGTEPDLDAPATPSVRGASRPM